MATKTRSRKNKGVKLQNKIVEILKNKFDLDESMIKPAIMGEKGVDIQLFGDARTKIPFDIEAKNQEKISIWEAIKQAEDNTKEGRIPLLVFKRNRSKIYCVLEFENFLDVFGGEKDDS